MSNKNIIAVRLGGKIYRTSAPVRRTNKKAREKKTGIENKIQE